MSRTTEFVASGYYGPWWLKLLKRVGLVRIYISAEMGLDYWGTLMIAWRWRGAKRSHVYSCARISLEEVWNAQNRL